MAAVDIIARGIAASAKSTADNAQQRIDALPKGVNYKGAVNKRENLPTSAKVGDLYSVKYRDDGVTLWGAEFVWGNYEGTNQWIELGVDYSADIQALQTGKADLPNELPPELKAEGVDYPWFMINMNPTGIDADANFHLVHSGYNFNSKQYFTWPEKVLPMAASTTNGGLMTAADKIKLDAAITDISGKQDKLTAGNGIKIAEDGKTISADVRTYKSFPNSWPHSTGTTIASFCAAVNASYKSGEAKIGDVFLGNVNSIAFFNGAYVESGGTLGSAEVSVQIMTPFGQNCVQLLTVTSSNNAPYHWEYTYVDGAITEGWRSWSDVRKLDSSYSSETLKYLRLNGTEYKLPSIDWTSFSGYDATKSQTISHDADGNIIWIDLS